MKKISYTFAVLALLAACAFKVAADYKVFDKPYVPIASSIAPTLQITQSPADAAANGICRGTLTLAVFSPEMGVAVEEVDSYNARYAADGKTCDELTLLGSVDYGDGNVDYIYRVRIAQKPLWYIFTIDGDGLVINIQ